LFWFVSLIEQRSGDCAGLTISAAAKSRAGVRGLMGIALFSSLGLPGLNGFVGEFLIFKGAFPLAKCFDGDFSARCSSPRFHSHNFARVFTGRSIPNGRSGLT